MPAALMTSSSECGHFWEVLSVNPEHSALKNTAPGKFIPFELMDFSLFLSFHLSVHRQVDVLYFHHCRKLCHHDSVSVLHVVKREGAAHGLPRAPYWRKDEWQTTEICHVRSTGEWIHHVSQQEELSPTKASESLSNHSQQQPLFSLVQAGEWQTSHKNIKDC